MATDHKTVADEIADRNPRSFEARWRMRVHRIADQPLWNHPLARVVAVSSFRVGVWATVTGVRAGQRVVDVAAVEPKGAAS